MIIYSRLLKESSYFYGMVNVHEQNPLIVSVAQLIFYSFRYQKKKPRKDISL